MLSESGRQKNVLKICKKCGKEFDTAIEKKIYCSKDCCNKYYTSQGRYGKKSVCVVCGKAFLTNKGFIKVCSQQCKQAQIKYGSLIGNTNKSQKPLYSECGFCRSEIPLGQRYCSAECRQNNIDRRKRKKPHIKTDIDGFCKNIPAGMSYGQYVASLEK